MMEEHNDNRTAPPRFRGKWSKFGALTLLFLVIFFMVGYAGHEGSSSSKFCASCHEMKPEYYTWHNSSHSEVACVDCHTEPGAENIAKSKVNTVEQAIKKKMQTYEAPIRMPSEITDASCEKCHNVYNRNFTVTGDLIIPHDRHKDEGISCIQCHSGVAHGKIADRKMTFQADYAKWDDKTGQLAMADPKYVKPNMDTCMDCHKARKITTECSACHTTGMVPETHKEDSFASKHGLDANEDLASCNGCHQDMSDEPLTGYEEISPIDKYLKQDKKQAAKNHLNYAKENTFCIDCHEVRPESHDKQFISSHGTLAEKNQESCMACHDVKKSAHATTTPTSTSKVYCASCHPSTHSQNKKWRERHPVPISPNQKLTQTCYTCHAEPKCASCHQEGKL
ncbi:NapC/NirT cytochrome c domain protein [Mesobacillus campisalis]|uniref:NapC/NirT cytochrome c domain protein n=1 Tax=Mesobacillus campisalis TaxID=1408103 RepID=A0A0M2SW56_9BACI|nr:NapC/NirT family cytochrome c [Mesobacillus campisalis]KKK38809.1 NapC/NirT cytochrome c domain protein [Mesobacillus campisalis]